MKAATLVIQQKEWESEQQAKAAAAVATRGKNQAGGGGGGRFTFDAVEAREEKVLLGGEGGGGLYHHHQKKKEGVTGGGGGGGQQKGGAAAMKEDEYDEDMLIRLDDALEKICHELSTSGWGRGHQQPSSSSTPLVPTKGEEGKGKVLTYALSTQSLMWILQQYFHQRHHHQVRDVMMYPGPFYLYPFVVWISR